MCQPAMDWFHGVEAKRLGRTFTGAGWWRLISPVRTTASSGLPIWQGQLTSMAAAALFSPGSPLPFPARDVSPTHSSPARLLPPRAAAIARRVYINQGLGVGGFRRIFGGRSNAKGRVTPEHHAKAAGGVIRHALQQLEAMGLVEKNPAARGGRRITPEGQRQVRKRAQHGGRAGREEQCSGALERQQVEHAVSPGLE